MNKKLLIKAFGALTLVGASITVIDLKNHKIITLGEGETCTTVFNKEVNVCELDGLKTYYSWNATSSKETTFSVELYTNQADTFSCGGDSFFTCKNYGFDAYAEGAKFYFNCKGVKSLTIVADFIGLAVGGINSNVDEVSWGVTGRESQTVYLESDTEYPLFGAYIVLPKVPDGEYTINSVVLEYDVGECVEVVKEFGF